LLALRLLSLHNLRFLLDVTLGARSAIEHGRLADFTLEMRQRMASEA
jgi:tRNA-guanine family transglycosylase